MHLVDAVFIVIFVIASNKCLGTPLDDYVHTPDPIFSWTRLQTYPLPTYTLYVLNMTSQRWFDESFSSQPIWWHYLTITVPRMIRRPKTSFLLISHGDNTDPVPATNPMTNLALSTDSITATINQIPNQPFRFWDDPLRKSREEDALIAWTWKKYFDANGSDPQVLLRFPMTKAVVRAMDAIQQFLQQQNIVVPEEFVIGGASKRGWTTWTTAATDNTRVVAAVPIVMDLLNLRPSMMSHYRSLAGWTFAFNDYHEMNITRYMNSSAFDKLAAMVDPYSYLDRYNKMKIFQLQGAGDEFFLPDSEDFFWNDLQVATGGSYLRRIPNTGHNIKGHEESLSSFYLSIADRRPLPSMKWTRTINGTLGIIHVVIDISGGKPQPTAVTAYQARTTDTLRRDFRQAKLDPGIGSIVVNPIIWTNTAVQFEGQIGATISYSLSVSIPRDGYWVAAFLQATFPGREGTTLILTTETLILPNTYPVKECHDQECYGQLV
ncbi:unnamed protein product [Rotaria socialis]|uniref:Uncharacterized protein n=1 Tax=Rotaria socialis TaxID=392032 RepID=A0A817PTJ7_9BILA|nr:unnamed protein product [Rotaria socialis]CAF3316018.1 unnamed protein product [Rotaria socialis]CAF3692904.1 unnamed protein product [Rotaria socialis]CAF3727958.1 unnamed protein product [Rotaria socialis]